MFVQCSSLIGAGALSLWLVCGAWAAPSQEDIDLCNKKAAEASVRTTKGEDETSPPPSTEPSTTEQSTARATDGGQSKSDYSDDSKKAEDRRGELSTVGMAPIGQKDRIYRFAYGVCLHQRGQ